MPCCWLLAMDATKGNHAVKNTITGARCISCIVAGGAVAHCNTNMRLPDGLEPKWLMVHSVFVFKI